MRRTGNRSLVPMTSTLGVAMGGKTKSVIGGLRFVASGSLPAMSIWRIPSSVEALQALERDTLAEAIGIRVIEIGSDYLRATMPVNSRTHQPMGVLHGGASVALAETVGSLAAN